MIMPSKVGQKMVLRNLNMFVWMSDFYNPLTHTHYRPKRSFGQGNIFTSVCHSVQGGGRAGLSNFSGGGGWGVPNFSGGGGGSPPEYGQRSAGTHPTGMHSCFNMFVDEC